MFANSFTDKPLPLWDSVVCMDETKAELHGNAVHLFIDKVNPVRKGAPYPQLKHGGDSIMWSCFAASSTGSEI